MQSTTLKVSAPVVPSVSEHSSLFKRLQSLVGWRMLAMATSAGGSIWASRCLGPDNLGMSAAVQAVSTQVILFTHFGQNNFLIRRYKHTANVSAKKELAEDVVVLRMTASLVLTAVALIALAMHGVPSSWMLPIGAGIGLFLLEAQTPDWLLQAQENQPAIYRSALWGALLCSGCYFAFFRPGVSAGSNLLVACAGALLVRVFTYKAAMADLGRLRPNPQHLKRALRLLWDGRVFFATAVVISIYTQGEQVLVTYYRPIEELGIYKSALQLTSATTTLFNVITSLLYPRFIEWQKQGANYLWQKQLRLGVIALGGWVLAATIILPGIPLIYPFVFGPQFAGGALPCALLLLSKILVIPVSIFIFCLWAHGRDHLMLAVTSITAVISLTLNLILVPKYGIVAAAAVNLCSEALMLIFGLILAYRMRH